MITDPEIMIPVALIVVFLVCGLIYLVAKTIEPNTGPKVYYKRDGNRWSRYLSDGREVPMNIDKSQL